MRTAAPALLATLSIAFVQLPGASLAGTGAAAARALEEANAALGATPPNREAALASLTAAISAGDDPDAVSLAHLLRGRLEEDDGAYEAAMADDRAAIASAPNTRWALRASDRIDWLRARSEGGFEPLRRLERLRRDPAQSNDEAAIDALARDAESFPSGTVRVEARMLVAEAYLGRLHRTDEAIAELRSVVGDPKTEPLTGRLAERELVDALAGEGRVDEAAAEARAHAARLDPSFATHIARLSRRRTVRWAAYAVLAAFVLMAGFSLVRARARGGIEAAWRAAWLFAPVCGAFVAFVGLAGGALASSYERGNAAPFLFLGLALLPLLLLSRAWGAVGSRTMGALVLRVGLSGVSVVAVAFVLLDGLTPAYLDGFGL